LFLLCLLLQMGGEDIGNYSIVKKIGGGGMGAVYLAEHTLLGRSAAIKVLLRELSHDQELVTRFFNEARAATSIKHPGIVEIYDFGYHTDGSAYIVMELLEGESLATRLRRSGPLPEGRASGLCRLIAGALGAAHAKGIVHRDLKPDNVFIVPDPDVANGERTKILDFGIAKLSTEVQGASKTRTGAVMGTPTYMSPEQCKGSGKVDLRADIYALGCILYEMVCGRAPFVAEGAGEVLAQHIYAPVPAPSSIAAVTPALEQAILRALAKEPVLRFQSANEMATALQTALASQAFAHVAATATNVSGYAARTAPASSTPPVVVASSPLESPTPPGTVQTTMSAVTGTAAITGAQSVGRVRSRMVALGAAGVIAAGAGVIALQNSGANDPSQVMASNPPYIVPPPKLPAVTPLATLPPAAPPKAPRPMSETPRPTSTRPAVPRPTSAAPLGNGPAAPPKPVTPAPTAHPTTITVRVGSTPSGAEVYRMPQRISIGATPLAYPLDAVPGEVALVLKLRGYRDQTIALPTDHDSDQTVTLVRIQGAEHRNTVSPEADSTDFFSHTQASPASPVTPSGSIDPFASSKQ
jgi:eukaryotic-like serine/threonine-protein kinase